MSKSKRKASKKKPKFQTAEYKSKLSSFVDVKVSKENLGIILNNLDNIFLIKRETYWVIVLGSDKLGWTRDITRVQGVYNNNGYEQYNEEFGQCIPIVE